MAAPENTPEQRNQQDPANALAGSQPAETPHAVSAVQSAAPGAILATHTHLGELTLTIARERIRDAAAALLAAGYTFLADVTCVDWLPSEPRFHVVYHLLSMPRKERIRLKVLVDSGDLSVDSVVQIFPSANFYEREIFDLFGIRFGGHPFLRRIMMPDDWEGHPLRKDYPVEGYR
jgi:NADH-quinone oxidoreductase subunit C